MHASRGRRARVWCQHAQRRRRQRRVNIGKSFTGKMLTRDPEIVKVILASGSDAFSLIESLIDRERIDCFWEKKGRSSERGRRGTISFKSNASPASTQRRSQARIWCPKSASARRCVRLLLRRHGGGALCQAAPRALLQGLLDAARRRQIPICAKAVVRAISRSGSGWRIATARGEIEAGDVVIATNGYTGDATPELKRRLIPLASHIIATEELPPDLARSLIPKGRTLADTKRVLCYYRMSPDGKRVIFGGRARFTP